MTDIRKIGVLVLSLALLLAAGCGRPGTGTEAGAAPRRQLETVQPNENDGAIYRATEEFVRALVADNREKVLSLLTSDHRASWRDESFLLSEEAKQQFEEFAMENLTHTVVRYINNEETNFQEMAMVFAVYDVVMKNGGQEANRIKMQDNLIFRQEGGQWLIAINERGFLVADN